MTTHVAIVTNDLLDRSRIEDALLRAGLVPVLVRQEAIDAEFRESPLAMAVVDLRVTQADEIIGLLASAGVAVTAYGPHVDRERLQRARLAGAGEVMARSRFFAQLGSMFASRESDPGQSES